MNELVEIPFAKRPPVCGVARDPLLGLVASDMRVVAPDTPLYSVMPAGDVIVCRLNGEWICQEDYAYRLKVGDVVEWHELPAGSNGLRTVLTLAVAVFMWWNPAGWTAGQLAFASLAANVAINVLLPPTSPAANGPAQPGQTYTTSLQGNQAKLNQPIWKVCGRRKIQPPFGGMPYQEFIDVNANGIDGKQFYFALFAVSLGNVDLESALIGGTPIVHFQDVRVASLIPPGSQPRLAKANVETSTNISGQVLEPGFYVGGFTACKPERTCDSIGIDVECPRGLTETVSWRVEVRAVNDYGVPIAPWSAIANESRSASTNTPQRWSYRYSFPSSFRPEVRLVRTNLKSTDPQALNELAWVGMRGYLTQSASLEPHTTHFECVLRGSSQLSSYSQRDFSLIVHGKARTWANGTWGPEVYTRNPAWWLLDLATSSVWGLGEPDDRIDLQGFADFAATCDARQDRFDWTFDTAIAAWDAMQMIARAGRARVFRRNGVLTVARDELQVLPVTAFTARNTEPESMSISETLPKREQPDGVVVEYEDLRTWQWTPIECPCPGVSSMQNPVRKRIEGIVGPTQARREGLYEAASLLYRTRVVSCKTEMEGVFPAYMSPVVWQPDIVGYGQTGDVAFWDPASLVLGLTEPPAWGAADLYIRLRRDDGTLTAAVKVTPGPSANDVVLPAAPDFDLILDDGARERPIFVLGPRVGGDELVKVTSILDGGKGSDGAQLFEVRGLIDDARVHAADNDYLPGPGDVQDPIDTTEAVADAATVGLVQLTSHSFGDVGSFADAAASFTLTNAGVLSYSSVHGEAGTIPGEWNLVPFTLAQASQFEVRATILEGLGYGVTLSAGSAATGVWLGLDTSRTWAADVATATGVLMDQTRGVALFLEIRRIGSAAIEASANITLGFSMATESGGT